MPKKGIEIKCCPVCESEDIEVDGNKVYCGDCNIEYKVTAHGTKPFDTNPLGKEKARIDKIEKDVAELKGKEPGPEPAEPEPAEPAEPEPGDNEDTDPKPFITW